MLCRCIVYIHTALKDSMFLKCCMPSLLVKVLKFQVPRTFCPENIELTAATPVHCCSNGENLVNSTTLPFPFSLHPSPTSPEKVRNLRKFSNDITRLYMQPGVFIYNRAHTMQLTTWLKSSICTKLTILSLPIVIYIDLHFDLEIPHQALVDNPSNQSQLTRHLRLSIRA